jgi:hypothetical protein
METALLCELHAHTTWSDGRLALQELVDLYGDAGFDVLCVTDHVLRSDDPWRLPESCVHRGNFASYLGAVDAEAERALALYGLLVVPGVELTHNHEEADLAAHAVAVGLRDFVSPDEGLVGSLLAAREAGAALVAAHPHGPEGDPVPMRSTRRSFRARRTRRPWSPTCARPGRPTSSRTGPSRWPPRRPPPEAVSTDGDLRLSSAPGMMHA